MDVHEIGFPESWNDLKFPSKLHLMLCQASEQGFDDIASWTACGKGFRIHNRPLFISRILPLYFPGNSQFKSFQRQLNLYGIQKGKMYHGNSFSNWNAGTRFFDEYSHPSLIRWNPGLTKDMTRPPSRRSRKSTATNPPKEAEHQISNSPSSVSSTVSTVDTGSNNSSSSSVAANVSRDNLVPSLDDYFMETPTTTNCCQDDEEKHGHGSLLEPTPIAFPMQGHIYSVNSEEMVTSTFTIKDLREEIITTFCC